MFGVVKSAVDWLGRYIAVLYVRGLLVNRRSNSVLYIVNRGISLSHTQSWGIQVT